MQEMGFISPDTVAVSPTVSVTRQTLFSPAANSVSCILTYGTTPSRMNLDDDEILNGQVVARVDTPHPVFPNRRRNSDPLSDIDYEDEENEESEESSDGSAQPPFTTPYRTVPPQSALKKRSQFASPEGVSPALLPLNPSKEPLSTDLSPDVL